MSRKKDDTPPSVYFIKMIVCIVGALLLASSDLLTNMSASDVLGSSEESRQAWWLVSIGCVIGVMGLGCVAEIMADKISKALVYVVAIMASIFSAALTVNAMSIDYAINDQANKNSKVEVKSNDKKIKNLEREQKKLNKKMDECERDRHYKACIRTEKRLEEITNEINEILDDSVRANEKKEIDLTYTVEEKSGIDGQTMERVLIYTRAGFVSIMIFVLSIGCSIYFGMYVSAKKQQTA